MKITPIFVADRVKNLGDANCLYLPARLCRKEAT